MAESRLELGFERTPVTEPRRALSLLARRPTILITGALVLLAAAAWFLTYRQSTGMAGMAMGLGQLGAGMPPDISGPLFMVMWLVMMVAMMFPAVAPIVLAHAAVSRKRGHGNWPSVLFVLAYLLVWTAFGLVPLAAFLLFQPLAMRIGDRLPLLAGAILVVAGAYQFTPLKSACLRACRNPISFVLTHDFGRGARSAFQAGISHGAYCLGCCWALMAILVVVGFMNLVWMGLLALVFFLEKNWRHGVALSRVAGTAVFLLGVAIALQPALLARIAGMEVMR